MPSSITNDRKHDYPVLDPCLLGRPVHLLPHFATRLGEALTLAMRQPARRRYWDAFDLECVEFTRSPDSAGLRWLAVASGHGTATVAFERPLLLALLDWRYGRNASPGERDPAAERVTATEERLAVVLTQQLTEVLFARIGAGLQEAALEGLDAAVQAPGAASAPAPGTWAVRLALRARSGLAGQIWLALDAALMASILRGLLPEWKVRREQHAPEPLATRLEIRLDARLVSKQITLSTLFGLQLGDVIPISVGRADVLLDESRLFTAAVAEHKGKLCLTSFEDAE